MARFSSIINPTKSNITFFSLSCTLLLLLSLYRHPTTTPPPLTINALADAFLSTGDNATISTYLRSLTLHPHLAGTPHSLSTALFLLSHFHSLNLSAHLTNYTALLSYPSLLSLSATTNSSTLFFNLSETSQNDVVKPYHAYSPSGQAYAPAVFVNYGREEDYNALSARRVSVAGCVAVVRRGGGMSRNAVAGKAADKGVAAVVMYTEGGQGFYRDGVERGTAMEGMGDPLTPGWASVDGGEKLRVEDGEVVERFPAVPSIPVSEETAESILRTLEGTSVPDEWNWKLKSVVRGIGPGPTMLNFTYQVG